MNWRVNNCFSPRKKYKWEKRQYYYFYKKLQPLGIVLKFDIINCLILWKHFSLTREEINISCYEIKNQIFFHNWRSFCLRILATLRNKRKLAAVSRETPENTKSDQSQNTLNPGMTEEYITQVSEENERRVTKKLSKKIAGKGHAFWVLCLNSMYFFWTHKVGLVP